MTRGVNQTRTRIRRGDEHRPWFCPNCGWTRYRRIKGKRARGGGTRITRNTGSLSRWWTPVRIGVRHYERTSAAASLYRCDHPWHETEVRPLPKSRR